MARSRRDRPIDASLRVCFFVFVEKIRLEARARELCVVTPADGGGKYHSSATAIPMRHRLAPCVLFMSSSHPLPPRLLCGCCEGVGSGDERTLGVGERTVGGGDPPVSERRQVTCFAPMVVRDRRLSTSLSIFQ